MRTRSWVGLLAVMLTLACEPSGHDPGPAESATAVAGEAVVESLSVYPGERREGMRKVKVTVAVSGDSPRKLTIVEWVPVVLLRRLAKGASIGLTPDPLEKDRMTLAL